MYVFGDLKGGNKEKKVFFKSRDDRAHEPYLCVRASGSWSLFHSSPRSFSTSMYVIAENQPAAVPSLLMFGVSSSQHLLSGASTCLLLAFALQW